MQQSLTYPLILLAIGTGLGIIGFFLKDIRASIRDKQNKQDQEIKELRDDLNNFKAGLPRVYVMRDDFLRAVTGLEMGVDTIRREITELNKNVSRLLGGEAHE
ncbi:MAG: hypothetical protein ACM3ZC_15470 [Bacteroidota bacterium]